MARNTCLPFRRPAPPAGHPPGTSSTLQHAPWAPPVPRGGMAGGDAPRLRPDPRRLTGGVPPPLPPGSRARPGLNAPFLTTRTDHPPRHPHQKGLRCRSPSFSSTASPPSTPWAPARCSSAFPAPGPSWSPSGPARSATTPDPSRSPPTAPRPTYRTPTSSWSPAGPAGPRRWTTRRCSTGCAPPTPPAPGPRPCARARCCSRRPDCSADAGPPPTGSRSAASSGTAPRQPGNGWSPTARTSPRPASPPAPTTGLTLLGRLAGDEHAQAVQPLTEYDPRPPYDTGSPRNKAPAHLVEEFRKKSRFILT